MQIYVYIILHRHRHTQIFIYHHTNTHIRTNVSIFTSQTIAKMLNWTYAGEIGGGEEKGEECKGV